MSRFGRKRIAIPPGVFVTCEAGRVCVKGPKGEEVIPLQGGIRVAFEEDKTGGKEVAVSRNGDDRFEKSLQGLIRSKIYNAVRGVTEGYQAILEINGVGYRASVLGRQVTLGLGFSHPVVFNLPEGIDASVEKQTTLILRGHDKYLVGQAAARIRALKKPEPYKGKGIQYKDEQIIRKETKVGKK